MYSLELIDWIVLNVKFVSFGFIPNHFVLDNGDLEKKNKFPYHVLPNLDIYRLANKLWATSTAKRFVCTYTIILFIT